MSHLLAAPRQLQLDIELCCTAARKPDRLDGLVQAGDRFLILPHLALQGGQAAQYGRFGPGIRHRTGLHERFVVLAHSLGQASFAPVNLGQFQVQRTHRAPVPGRFVERQGRAIVRPRQLLRLRAERPHRRAVAAAGPERRYRR